MSNKALTTTDKATAGANILIDALRRVDKARPTKEDRAELARILRESPAVWIVAGDLADQAQRQMITKMAAPASMKMSIQVGLEQMAADLTHPADGALETLIIKQIVGAWLRLSFIEYNYSVLSVDGDATIKRVEYWERRLSAAQRRYLRAIETLARVRRLQLPAVQVNIGNQQVNQVT